MATTSTTIMDPCSSVRSSSYTAPKPGIKRTYGKSTRGDVASSSAPSMIFASSPPSSPLLTPHASSSGLLDGDIPILPFSSPSMVYGAGRGSNADKENVFEERKPFVAMARSEPTQSSLRGFFITQPAKKTLQKTSPNASSSGVSSSQSNVTSSSSSNAPTRTKSAFTQLHLTHLPLLHTCQQCQMSFVRGGDDESTHEKHHARVVRGIIWEGLGRAKISATKGKGKERARDPLESGWRVVRDNVELGYGKVRGKVVMLDASWGGSRLHDILQTVDTVLSSPPLPTPILDQCRLFIFVTSSPAPARPGGKRPRPLLGAKEKQPKERIVGVVVSQGIKIAMRVLREGEKGERGEVVDSGDGVLCDPAPLPTPLGIHRLFTIPTYRSLGIAQLLLDAACQHTIYGCRLDPSKGEVAFSQPTSSGRAVMEQWGGGGVRVFVDDERQL